MNFVRPAMRKVNVIYSTTGIEIYSGVYRRFAVCELNGKIFIIEFEPRWDSCADEEKYLMKVSSSVEDAIKIANNMRELSISYEDLILEDPFLHDVITLK